MIRDCDLHSEYLSKFPKNRSANQKPRKNKPVWNHANRVNHSNFSRDYRYPHQKRPFPSTGKPHVSQAVPSQSTVKTTPNQGTENYFASIRPRKFNTYTPRRPYTSKKVPKPKTPKPTVKSVWVKKESTAGEKPLLSVNKGKIGKVV